MEAYLRVSFKSYEQGTDSFVGTAIDFIHLDEEPPLDVYTQCLMRTATTDGIILCTFTPIHSITEVVKMFLMPESYDGKKSNKFVVMCAWDDVPHLTEEAKAELLESIPIYQRDAISKGLPQLGRGAIYPVSETVYMVDNFEIPPYWPRLYAMDVGWNATAAVWMAWDRESDVIYVYSEYFRGQAEPSIHADAIKSRGVWVRGLIDPAARGRSQNDGTQLYQVYRELGLNITLANNAVEAGIHTVFQRLSAGRLRIFKTCRGLVDELRIYRRDDHGKGSKRR
jgi:phage terminase large subunit-like protein